MLQFNVLVDQIETPMCTYQRPAWGADPLANPRGTHGLGRGFAATMSPGIHALDLYVVCFHEVQ